MGLAIAIAIAIQIQIQIAIAIQIVETPRRRHLGAVDTRRIATFVVIVALADA